MYLVYIIHQIHQSRNKIDKIPEYFILIIASKKTKIIEPTKKNLIQCLIKNDTCQKSISIGKHDVKRNVDTPPIQIHRCNYPKFLVYIIFLCP
jgi:hypothetical protein